VNRSIFRKSDSDFAKPMSIWLLVCCATIFAMVILGGVTRLTDSGLSMVQWRPILGTVPPLTEQAWQDRFALYKEYPEFQEKNFDLKLDGFKTIFWIEFAHRLLGRSIAILFFLPMIYFFVRYKLSKILKIKLLTMFVLGGLQGLMGWYMVQSGLVDNPHVSQYRLTAHLGLAFLIYGFILWVAYELLFPQQDLNNKFIYTPLFKFSCVIVALVSMTVLAGGLVAGLHAGMVYNTFPLMDGQWVPDGILQFDPLWRNFFENVTTVQFDHRILAITTFIAVCLFWVMVRNSLANPKLRMASHLLLGMAVIQVSLGISTLLLHVPLALAPVHQAGGLLLFTAALLNCYHALNTRVQFNPEQSAA
jgi:cytochrome c oxidase assembly protein subunit 15